MVERPPRGIDPAIKAYYDRAPEESRLELGVFRLEQLRSRELILRHAPEPPAVVLDVGGAAGAYAFWLAERGFSPISSIAGRVAREPGRWGAVRRRRARISHPPLYPRTILPLCRTR